MKAVNHITFATSTTLGLSLYTQQVFFLPFIFFVALAALIPDIDHPKSELGKMLVLPSKILKHRGLTHSILGVFVFGGILYLSQSYPTTLRYALLVICYLGSLYLIKILSSFITTSLGLDPTKLLQKRAKILISLLTILIHGALLLSAFLIWNNRLYQEILLLTGLGYILHIVGDFVTKEGVPLFWPIKKKFGLKLFRTGKTVESILGVVFILLNLYFVYQFVIQFDLLSKDYWQDYLIVAVTS